MSLEAYVLSDIHLGAGPIEPELEDFDQDDHLAAFVDRIARPGVTLFINGDFIDFPQIPPYEVGPADHLLWDEASSVQKVEHTIAAHGVVFAALRRFVDKGGALRIHAGNHDLDLAWPAVQARLREEVGAALELSLTWTEYHGVHIEHGHMFTPENAPKDAAKLIHPHEGPDGTVRHYVERVWGTDFMLQFYNDLERKHRFADNVKPMLTTLYYGLKNGWVGGKEVLRLLLFLKRSGVPWAGVGSAVLAGPPSENDVPRSFEDREWQKVITDRLRGDLDFREELRAEIEKLPNEQKRLLNDGEKVKLDVADPADPKGATLGLFREERQIRAAKDRLAVPGITHVIFGHTHEVIDGELGGCLFNTGTWLPHMDFNRPNVKEKIKAFGLTPAMLSDASLYERRRTVGHIIADLPRQSRVELVLADDVR